MTRRLSIVALGLVLSTTAMSPLASGRAARGCVPKGAQRVLQNEYAVVYRTQNKRGFVCNRKTRRRKQLPDAYTPGAFEPAMAGRYLAYQAFFDGTALNLFDVRRLRKVTDYEIYANSFDGTLGIEMPLEGLHVSEAGYVTWISVHPDGMKEVRTAPPDDFADPTLLDSDPGITSGSLAVSDDFIYWQVNGEPRFASALPGS